MLTGMKWYIAAIAPSDYRDASNEIIGASQKEMKGRWDQIMQWILLGGVIIFAMVSIILITQMVSKSQQGVSDLYLQIAQKCSCEGGVPSINAP